MADDTEITAFGFSLKPLQINIIKSILQKTNTFGILPTGYGKSMTYMALPALSPGKVLVITYIPDDRVDQFVDGRSGCQVRHFRVERCTHFILRIRHLPYFV